MALRPPERHMTIIVSSGLAISFTRDTKSNKKLHWKLPLFSIPLVHLSSDRNFPCHGRMADKEKFLRGSDVENFYLFRIGLPLFVGFFRRHIESQHRLLSFRKGFIGFGHIQFLFFGNKSTNIARILHEEVLAG